MDSLPAITSYIPALEERGLVTRTFRRLDPDRQRAIVDAILDEASERGPASVNVKTIARRAGVAVGSLYRYFPDRDRLLDAAVTLCTEYVLDVLRSSRPYLLAMPFREALLAYLSVGVEWGRTERKVMRFLGRAAYQGDAALREGAVRPIATEMRTIVRDLLRAAAERGEIRRDLDLETASRLVNAFALATADSQLLPYLNDYFQLTDEAPPSDRLADAFVEFVCRSLGC